MNLTTGWAKNHATPRTWGVWELWNSRVLTINTTRSWHFIAFHGMYVSLCFTGPRIRSRKVFIQPDMERVLRGSLVGPALPWTAVSVISSHRFSGFRGRTGVYARDVVFKHLRTRVHNLKNDSIWHDFFSPFLQRNHNEVPRQNANIPLFRPTPGTEPCRSQHIPLAIGICIGFVRAGAVEGANIQKNIFPT